MPSAVIYRNAFSEQECERLIELGRQSGSADAALDKGGDTIQQAQYRSGAASWLSPTDESTRWAFEKSLALMHKANATNWDFQLNGEDAFLQFTSYYVGDFYDWHLDIGESHQDTGKRKLSLVLQLSDPAEYSGGDLELFVQREPRNAPRDRGTVIIFPSYNLHRVTPVTDGSRFSLVHWATGEEAYS